MRKVTKLEETCNECGRTTKCEEYEEFCDNCETKLEGDDERGHKYSIKYLLHDDDGHYKGGTDFHFCSIECEFNWLKENGLAKFKHRDDFMSLEYLHEEQFEKLLAFVSSGRLGVK